MEREHNARAHAVLAMSVLGPDLVINVADIRSGILTYSFFGAFLQTVSEHAPERLPVARSIRWTTRYPFKDQHVKHWIREFSPQ